MSAEEEEPAIVVVTSSHLRKFKKIPIFIVENHNDVLEFILKCLASRYLPFENNTILHFDSHPDLCFPRSMPANFVFDKVLLLESLSIENWISPTLFAGHIGKVMWVKPPWAQQLPKGTHNFLVGSYENRIHTNCTLDYFLTDGCYQPEEELVETKEIQLHVSEIGENLNELIDEEKHLILDIDLDYFSTHNPFLKIYPQADTYKKLKEIFYRAKDYEPDDLDSVQDFVDERNELLDFLEEAFSYLNAHKSLKDFEVDDEKFRKPFELVEKLVEDLCCHYKMEEIEWLMIYDAGCTCDDDVHELPHHESDEEELKDLLGKFEKFMKSLKKRPTIITIARSSLDDYCPVQQVEHIQNSVLQILRNIYGEELADNPALWYKTEGDQDPLDLILT